MELMGYKEFINESKGMPDLGETITFEDSFEMKNEKNGKKVKITPKDEFEVIDVLGLAMKLSNKKIEFYITKGEYNKLGGYLL